MGVDCGRGWKKAGEELRLTGEVYLALVVVAGPRSIRGDVVMPRVAGYVARRCKSIQWRARSVEIAGEAGKKRARCTSPLAIVAQLCCKPALAALLAG